VFATAHHPVHRCAVVGVGQKQYREVFEIVLTQQREDCFGLCVAVVRPADHDAAESRCRAAEAPEQRQCLRVVGNIVHLETLRGELRVHRAPARS
jgi:hypothetical protein